MNKIKSLYEVPTINILVVRLEGVILTGSNNAQSMDMPFFIKDTEEDW